MSRTVAGVFTSVVLLAALPAQADVLLGGFDFSSTEFGNTLIESDGGAYSAGNWLNVANTNPGNPGYLTGANFNTGIANIGHTSYTIGYADTISNGAGNDFGVVTARYSADPFKLAVSTDGVTFTADQTFAAGLGVATGVNKAYYYGGFGPYSASLYVTAIDLSSFGLAAGSQVQAIRITGYTELDLIRVAGFANPVPEPTTPALMLAGLMAVGVVARRRKTTG